MTMSINEEAMKNGEKVVALHVITCICASCKRIRNNDGLWSYVADSAKNSRNNQSSHGICPECIATIYPWFEQDDSVSLK